MIRGQYHPLDTTAAAAKHAVAPPADDEVSKYLSVCFNSQKMVTADVGKREALTTDPLE